MCHSCVARAAKLRELSHRFKTMADAGGDPSTVRRLRRTAAELEELAGQLSLGCAATGDVVWAEDAVVTTPPTVAMG